MDNNRILKYLEFVVLVSVIIAITSYKGLFLLAPPYAVSAYLATFEPSGKHSKRLCIIFSYFVVIVSTEFFHILIGISIISLILNVLVVSFFITFSRYSHPPAIALTIFSYIVHNSEIFVITSLIALAVIIGFQTLYMKIGETFNLQAPTDK